MLYSGACHCWPPIALHWNQLECLLNWVRITAGMYNIGMESRRKATDIEGVIGQSICDHRKIVAVLKIRDPIAAYHAMANHLIQIELSNKEALEDSQVTEINRLGP